MRALPDRAVVSVSVASESETRDIAYAAAAECAASVDAVLEAASEGFERAVTTALAVQPKMRWDEGERRQVGWTASRASAVTIVDLDRVASLMAALVNAGASVYGPQWQLTESHPAHDEARRAAGRDARRRAEAYAGALGVRLGRLAWAAEPGLRSGAETTAWANPSVSRVAASLPEEEDVIDVEAGEITVRAELDVGFTITYE